MITKDVALNKIRDLEAKTVKDGFSEKVRSIKNDFFDTLVRVINSINPREAETMENVISLGSITISFSDFILDNEMPDEEVKECFEVLYEILDRILIDARPANTESVNIWTEKLKVISRGSFPECLNCF